MDTFAKKVKKGKSYVNNQQKDYAHLPEDLYDLAGDVHNEELVY